MAQRHHSAHERYRPSSARVRLVRSRRSLFGAVLVLALAISAAFVSYAVDSSHDSGYVSCITSGLNPGTHAGECLEGTDDTTTSTTPSGTMTTSQPTQTAAPTSSKCGTDYLASGWPTTTLPSPAGMQCIMSAFRTGRRATYIELAQTDGRGGHSLITTFTVLGERKVLVTTNPTASLHGGRIRREVCTGLLAEMSGLSPSRCRHV